jgi:starch-binding outer membrane protein, SusD/RagB family
MKLKCKIYPIVLFFILVTTFGCDEDEILNEKPLSFASPAEAYRTNDDFNNALAGLYDQARRLLASNYSVIHDQLGTDLGVNNNLYAGPDFSYYPAYLISSATFVSERWTSYYKIISNANIILSRLKDAKLTDGQKVKIEATARFFRGLCYKNLAHLYGGVPIELEEITYKKIDYTRSTREAVYQQAASDLEFASQKLPGINEVVWQVSNLAAYHVLAEVYITQKKWTEAIQATSVVINSPNTALMTQRFGTRSGEPGDVFWDLFRRGNQNRSSGNTEAIMVWQTETDVLGGILVSSGRPGMLHERNWAPFTQLINYMGPDGITPFLTTQVSDYTGGRGIGYIRGTWHYLYEIWRADWNDMRNSKYNMVRDVAFNNPKSIWFGQMLIADHSDWFPTKPDDSIRFFYPYPSKVTTPGNHPAALYVNKDLGTLAGAAGSTYTDWYFIRLAETYLLRAEAYLGMGDKVNAAADINVVRARANAIPAQASEIDIDLILDERLKEFGPEEYRRLTLHRLGLTYERVTRYAKPTGYTNNHLIQVDGMGIEPHHDLWPIPFSEIERNRGAVLEQNPGYSVR